MRSGNRHIPIEFDSLDDQEKMASLNKVTLTFVYGKHKQHIYNCSHSKNIIRNNSKWK